MSDRDSDTSMTLLEQLSDQPNETSWGRLLELYSPLLRSWLGRYEVQASDADDLIQDVLIVVLRELPEFKHNHQTGAFRNWLRRILVNRLRNFWRDRRRNVNGGDCGIVNMLQELEDSNSQLTQLWEHEHDQYLITRLLSLIEPQFSESTRTAFRRLAIDGATGRQVAGELGLSVSAVFDARSRVTRELRRLGRGLID